ncbi:MAG: DSBA oxidoreductase [Xanthobacteraceae bacterium]|nr:MAG: DSBA oxidoreductase [Xanthobacteraceae bacterium]
MLLTRRLLLMAGLAALPGPLAAQEGWYPLKDGAGRDIQNFRVPVELQGEIMALDNAVTLGSADADITLIEIYDSNCSFCRRAANDVKAMTAADTDLAVSLINAPSLGLPSVQAARVEYAVKKLGGEAKAREFHARSMAARGVFDGIRALEMASDLGLDREAVEDVADRPETGQVIVQAVRLANATNLAATPSWLIAGTAIIGWPGRAVMERIIAAVRDCDKPVCT